MEKKSVNIFPNSPSACFALVEFLKEQSRQDSNGETFFLYLRGYSLDGKQIIIWRL